MPNFSSPPSSLSL